MKTIIPLAALLLPVSAQAVILVGNTFDGSTNNAALYTTGQTTATDVTSAGVGREGYTLNGGNGALVAGELRGFVQPVNNSTRYFTFEVTPINGASISFTNFTYTGFTTLNSGTIAPDFFEFRASPLGGLGSSGSAVAGASESGGVIDLSGAAFQNITTAVQFRLYVQADDAASSGTTYSIDSFSFNGTVTSVPEPSAMALGLLGVFGLVVRRRR